MKPLKQKISITVDHDIVERIKEIAEPDDRSVSSYINIVLRKHFNEMERRRQRSAEEMK